MLRTTLVYIFIGIYALILTPFSIIWTACIKDPHVILCLARFCIRVVGVMSGVRVDVAGREKIDAKRTCIFLSNHQGNFDGPVLMHVLNRDMLALVKKELLRVPVLSSILRAAQFVPLERANPKQARAGIERGAQLLKEGKSFFSFPEGTRSRDGSLGEFKKGVFIMAIKASVPVVPITISNSSAIQPPGSYSIHPGRIRVVIHDPIETQEMTLEDRNILIQQTRAAIASAL